MAEDQAAFLVDLPRLTLPGALLAVPVLLNAPALVLVSGMNLILIIALAPFFLFGFGF